MSTWVDRFAAMSHEDRLQTIAEDGSTLQAFIHEAQLTQDWYRRWCLERKSMRATTRAVAAPPETPQAETGKQLIARAMELEYALMCQDIDSDAGNCDERGVSREHWCVVCTAAGLADLLRAALTPSPETVSVSRETVTRQVTAIETELRGRQGFDNVYDDLDTEVLTELREAMAAALARETAPTEGK